MSKKPLVSVLTPAYNAEKYLVETIEGILSQSFSDFEFIIIDDRSTDKTWQIIKEYAKKDTRIIPLQNEKNLGIAGNRNKGLKYAQGEYIVWQDADDISLPDRLEKQVSFMQEHKDVAICGGFIQFFDYTGLGGVRKYKPDDNSLRKTIFRFSPVAQPAAIIRKSCLDEVGSYDLEFPPAEDLDMSFRLGRKYKFANIQSVVLRYREHPNSATFSKLRRMELLTLKIRKKHAKDSGYKMTIGDKIFNFLQFISIYLFPPNLKIKIFNFFRNDK
ncbi:MAG: glycosyltransferase [Candidatus Berkelbacteria bacterium]|nr:glycosyltransferase [Candidatus Berkelbacteria bacterium]